MLDFLSPFRALFLFVSRNKALMVTTSCRWGKAFEPHLNPARPGAHATEPLQRIFEPHLNYSAFGDVRRMSNADEVAPVTSLRSDQPHSHELTMSTTYGIIHAPKLGWERVSPSCCQRARAAVSRVSETDRRSSRSCEPKSRGEARRVGETEPSFVSKDADMTSIRLSARLSGSRVVPREPGSRLCREMRAFC